MCKNTVIMALCSVQIKDTKIAFSAENDLKFATIQLYTQPCIRVKFIWRVSGGFAVHQPRLSHVRPRKRRQCRSGGADNVKIPPYAIMPPSPD